MPVHPIILRLGLMLGLLHLAVAAAPGTEARPLRVLMEHASPPFASLDPGGQPEGFVVDLLRAVAVDQQLHLEFDLRPWQQVYADFRAGQGDILGLVVATEERAQLMDFTTAYVTMECGLYSQAAGPTITSTRDLRGKRIAVIRDAAAHEFARRQDWGAELMPFATLSECIQALARGECDALMGMDLVTDHLVRTLPVSGIVRQPLRFPSLAYRLCLAVQPGQKHLLAQLNQGLVNLHAGDTYDRLYERWLGPLSRPALRWRDLLPYLLPALGLLATLALALVWQRRLLRRLRAQALALKEGEERLSLVLEGSTDGFWDWDVTSGRVLRSARWAEMLGRKIEQIPPTREGATAIIHPEDLARITQEEQALWSGRDQYETEFRMQTAGGEWKWILDRGKVVRRDPATRRPLRIAGTHTDITARKFAELENKRLGRKMLEAQKLESLGVLAGGVAHDFNNLLTVILGNASIIRLDLPAGSDHAARVDKIVTASNRAADLCRQLLAYAGKGSMTETRFTLNDLVQESARLLEVTLNRRARLDFALTPDLPPLLGDPTQISQVVMNLVLNAAEAMTSRDGLIRVTTRSCLVQPGELLDALPSGPPAPGAYLLLEVSDTGSGMPPEVLARIFDPFFTTKFAGRGLGLPAVLGIVRAHGGALTVRSQPGQGSVFSLYFPVAEGAVPAQETPQAGAPEAPGSGGVLIADDEEYIRDLAAEILGRAGYTVVQAEDGEEAYRLFRAQPGRFAVLVLDLTMPRLDGAEALRRMRALRPDIPCVLSSGHSAEEVKNRYPGLERVSFAQKPFTPTRLLEAVRTALKGP